MRPVYVTAALAAVLLLNACSAGAPRGAPAASSEDRQMTNSPSSQHPTPAHSSASVTEIPIRVSFGDTTLTARLTNNPTALDLLSQLPLTLTFRDFNQVEKIADLPRPLSTDGAPPGSRPRYPRHRLLLTVEQPRPLLPRCGLLERHRPDRAFRHRHRFHRSAVRRLHRDDRADQLKLRPSATVAAAAEACWRQLGPIDAVLGVAGCACCFPLPHCG
jgi:hypothetical protein